MPIVSKTVKLIAALILSATISLLVFSVSYSWSGLIPLLASIGGEIVFLGLWIEKEADEADKKEHLSNLIGDARRNKFKSEIGWWILMIGIVAEVIFGSGLAAFDVWQARQLAIKNDPNNMPIAFVSARAILVQLGTNRNDIDPTRLGVCNLTIGSSEQTNFWRPTMPWNLTCSSFENWPFKIDSQDSGPKTEWILDFKQSMMLPTLDGSVKDADKWDAIKFEVAFLPVGTEILGGKVRLTINTETKEFIIPPQKIKNTSDLDDFCKKPPKSVTLFTW
jgi:hypothetical protein